MALSDAQMQQFMAAQQQQAKEQVLFTFNCGSMDMAKDKTVTADKRKGKVVLSMEDDGLLRFQWRLRHSEENQLQFFIFPQGATWTRVSDCKDGRVFLLKFKDSDVRRFFWLQEAVNEKSTKRDAEILRRVTSIIDNPPKFGAPLPKEEEEKDDATDTLMTDVSSVSVNGTGGVATIQGTGNAAAGVAATQETRGAVAVPPATTASTAAAAASSSSSSSAAGPLNTNSLLSTLNAMAQQLAERQAAQSESGAKVEDVLDAERLQPILDADRALIDALVEFLPEGQRSPEDLRQQLRSPQMQSTMARLSGILNSSQFGQIMASMSLPVNAQTGLGVDAFIAAIQEQAKKQQKESK